MDERFSHLSPEDVYFEKDNIDGIGDRPPLDGVPGVRIVSVVGLKTQQGFFKAIQRGGPVRKLINELRDKGSHVAASWSAGEVTLFVARHRKALKATAAVLGVVTAVSAIYLTRRSPKPRK